MNGRSSINAREFGSVFTIDDAGTVSDGPPNLWAPECYHDETTDIDLCGAADRWAPIVGWTGQYGYSGAVMHPAEYVGGALESWLLDSPGTYCLVVVDCLSTDDDSEPEPAGWAILHYTGPTVVAR